MYIVPLESHITYRLKPGHRPSSPLKEWRGRVEKREYDGSYIVTVLNEGYEDLEDRVDLDQIIEVDEGRGIIYRPRPPFQSLSGLVGD